MRGACRTSLHGRPDGKLTIRSCRVGTAQRLEPHLQLIHEGLRLLPGGKVTTLWKPVVVDQVGICLLGPTPRRLGEFIREGAHGHRKLHALRAKEAELVADVVLPVETGRGNPGVRKPEQRDVV